MTYQMRDRIDHLGPALPAAATFRGSFSSTVDFFLRVRPALACRPACLEEGFEDVFAGGKREAEGAVATGVGDLHDLRIDDHEGANAGEQLVADLVFSGAAGRPRPHLPRAHVLGLEPGIVHDVEPVLEGVESS